MSRRRLLVLITVPIFVLPVFGWRFASSPPLVASSPANAYSPSPVPPQLFPPPGSRVPANAELRVSHAQVESATVTAMTSDKHVVELVERPLGPWSRALRPAKPPKPGTTMTVSLERRADAGTRPYGEGVLGRLTWTADLDRTAPVLTLIGGLTRTDAVIDGGRAAGFPDSVQVVARIEDESPVAVILQLGTDVPRVSEDASLTAVTLASDGTTTIRASVGGSAPGRRLAIRAVDAAGNLSAWVVTGVIPPASDEAKPLPADGSAAGATTSAASKPRSGCSR